MQWVAPPIEAYTNSDSHENGSNHSHPPDHDQPDRTVITALEELLSTDDNHLDILVNEDGGFKPLTPLSDEGVTTPQNDHDTDSDDHEAMLAELDAIFGSDSNQGLSSEANSWLDDDIVGDSVDILEGSDATVLGDDGHILDDDDVDERVFIALISDPDLATPIDSSFSTELDTELTQPSSPQASQVPQTAPDSDPSPYPTRTRANDDIPEATWTLESLLAEWENDDVLSDSPEGHQPQAIPSPRESSDLSTSQDQNHWNQPADGSLDESITVQTNIDPFNADSQGIESQGIESQGDRTAIEPTTKQTSTPSKALNEGLTTYEPATDDPKTVIGISEGAVHDDPLPSAIVRKHTTEAELLQFKEPSSDTSPLTQIDPTSPLPLGPPVNSQNTAATEFQLLNSDAHYSLPQEDADQNGFVRVGIQHLNQLNDLFGELTIDRNGLTLRLKRLRTLVTLLSRRVQGLEQVNGHLRSVYDQGSIPEFTQGIVAKQSTLHTGTTVSSEASLALPSVLTSDFDTLEMDQYTGLHHLFQSVMEGVVQIQEIVDDLNLNLDDSEQSARSLNKTARQLQTKLMHARMRPLSEIANRFSRALRELSLKHSKPVEFKLQGGSTLIDRTILDSLSEPLMHIVRNAFDHGIETPAIRRASGKPEVGYIEIRAHHRGNRTIISVADDGQGIALDRVRARARQMGLDEMLLASASEEELLSLIFEPGFSTAEKTTNLSGRGVGMDVVRDRLQQVHGDIKITTRVGQGTTFSLSLPLTLSVTRVLLAESNGMLIAIPTDAIDAMVILEPDQIIPTVGREVFEYDGKMAELIRLNQWLQFHCPRAIPDAFETAPSISRPSVLIIKRGTQITGIEVEQCWREQEVTVRRVAGTLPLPEGFSSCTILGDGRVVPLVNVSALLHWIVSHQRSATPTPSLPPPPTPLLPGHSSSQTPFPPKNTPSLPSPAPGILPAASNGSFTIYPQAITPSSTLPQPPQHSPISPAYSNPQPTAYPLNPKPNVLVVDDSIAVRRLLALTLEKASYRVEQAKDGQDALEKLNKGQSVDVIISDIEMPRLDGYRFLAKLQASDRLRHLPVLMVTSRSGDKHRKLAMSLGATDYFSKPYDEQALINRLAEITGMPAVVGR
ncbi:MAG: hybrid sensor histidine kinase/response regulator [Merismopedia sp. SIO2A8]|nr:hybrid sensor histidine kinase/response regulator [Merismopedia sp. SIO2A8]